jgi:flagella basal body P-ring formation protein FlgA
MIMAIPLLLALAPPVLSPPAGACLPVQEDRIYGRDVAAAVPEFAAFPSAFSLSYAPAPGQRRILMGSFLQKAAKNHGLEIESAPDVCFERPLSSLREDDLRAAMSAAFENGPARDSAVQIEVLEWGPKTAPQGTVIFPRNAIQTPSGTDHQSGFHWRGYVLYGGNHRFALWARVRVSAAATRVVAIADISPGKPIRQDQVRLESSETFALDARPARHLDEVVGFTSHNFIRSGAFVLRSQLSRLPEVAKGDLVKVHVSAGSARLVLEGRAETSGTTGSPIWVKNLSSGKEFRGTVAGKGTVTLGETSAKEERIQ